MIYNLFISHSWSYTNAYENLISLLNNDPNFTYRDYSIPKYDPVHCGSDQQLTTAIFLKMQPCHCVLVLAGVYSTYSKWINKEISIAKNSFGKPIIAIEPWAAEKTSVVVRDNADVVVGWNTKSITDAIRRCV